MVSNNLDRVGVTKAYAAACAAEKKYVEECQDLVRRTCTCFNRGKIGKNFHRLGCPY